MPALICLYKGTCLCIPSCPLPFLCLSIVSGSESSCAGSLDALKISVDLPAKREHRLNEHPSNTTSPIPLHKKCQDTGGAVRSDSTLKLLFPELPVWNKIAILTERFTPPQLLGPRPRRNQFKHANGRRQNRQIRQIDVCSASENHSLTKHCGLTR